MRYINYIGYSIIHIIVYYIYLDPRPPPRAAPPPAGVPGGAIWQL